MIYGIYKIINKTNDKIYIGSTSDKYGFKARWKAHRTALRAGKHYNKYLQRSWTKYGEVNFEFEILEECDNRDKCIPREQYYIDSLKPEFNICKTAGSTLGRKHSKETKLKISRNRVYGNGWNKGLKMNAEARLNMSNAQKNSKKNAKLRAEISKRKMKPVIGINIDTGEILELNSMNAKEKEFHGSGISACIYGKIKTYKRYKWKFKA